MRCGRRRARLRRAGRRRRGRSATRRRRSSGSPRARARSGRRCSGRTAWASSSRTARRPGSGAPPDRRLPGTSRCSASPARSLTPSSRSAVASGFRCVVSSGAEAVTDAADYLAFFAEDEGTRAVGLFLETVRRPDAFVAALDGVRCGGQAGRLPQGRPLRGGGAGGARRTPARSSARTRAFSAVLRRYGAIEVEDFHELVETLEMLGRGAGRAGSRIGAISESGGECALLADQAEAAGIPFEPLPSRARAAPAGRVPELPRARQPARRVGGRRGERVVYPRSLELMAESGAFDILVAQADLSQFRDPGNEEWCELTLRTLARAARPEPASSSPGRPCTAPTHRAHSRSSHASSTSRSCAGRATRCSRSRESRACGPSRSPPTADAMPDITDLLPARRRALRARVGARARALRRPVRPASPGGDPRRRGTRRPRSSDSPSWSSSTARRTRAARVASSSDLRLAGRGGGRGTNGSAGPCSSPSRSSRATRCCAA